MLPKINECILNLSCGVLSVCKPPERFWASALQERDRREDGEQRHQRERGVEARTALAAKLRRPRQKRGSSAIS